MKTNKNLMLVDACILPPVFSKVLEAKKRLNLGTSKTVSEASAAVGISRSAFYKYKDCVFPFRDMRGILTLSFELADVAGILSDILNILAKARCNILTINQNIPVNGVANITISLQNDEPDWKPELFLKRFDRIKGIKSLNVLAKE